MPKDMRTWINELEEAAELTRITKPVHPHTQMGALLYQSREKGLLFEKLDGFPPRGSSLWHDCREAHPHRRRPGAQPRAG